MWFLRDRGLTIEHLTLDEDDVGSTPTGPSEIRTEGYMAEIDNKDTILTDDHPVMNYVGASILGEWDGVVEVPYLDALLAPTERLHVKHILPLATDTQYGNLQTSWITLLADISAINIIIQKTNQDHALLREFLVGPGKVPKQQGLYTAQRKNAEQLSQALKTLVDHFIMLLAVVSYDFMNGEYPKKIKPNSIGEYLNMQTGQFCDGKLDKYRPTLIRLNTVANALKHTFLNLQSSSIINKNTPGVIVFYQQNNDTKKGSAFEYILFSNTVKEINRFTYDAKVILSAK